LEGSDLAKKKGGIEQIAARWSVVRQKRIVDGPRAIVPTAPRKRRDRVTNQMARYI
jgi:hypothetical protein